MEKVSLYSYYASVCMHALKAYGSCFVCHALACLYVSTSLMQQCIELNIATLHVGMTCKQDGATLHVGITFKQDGGYFQLAQLRLSLLGHSLTSS